MPIRTKIRVTAVLLLGCLTGFGIHAQTNLEAVAIVPNQGDGVGYIPNGTIGWAFTPSVSIQITSLGCIAGTENDDVSSGVEIGLWKSDGTLLASTIIYTNSPQLNWSQYEPVAPVSLASGSTYVLGASAMGQQLAYWFVVSPGFSAEIHHSGVAMTPTNQTGFAFPSILTPDTDSEVDVPAVNFLFEVVQPQIVQTVIGEDNAITLTWTAVSNQTYQLQYVADLTQTNWSNLGGPITATNSTASASDSILPPPSQRFYRVALVLP